MKSVMLKKLMFLIVFVSGNMLFSQITVNGSISETGGAIPGVNILVKGTANGAVSDFDGNYQLNNVGENDILIFSFVGFVTQEVSVNGRTTIDITMVQDAAELEAVVVVGYTAQTRADLTGSVASVDLTEAIKQPVANVAETLEGRVPGVSITNNGAPGGTPVVRIRGFGTTNNNNPLYIIDGLQTTDAGILNTLNPNDIEQFNVLKDGAASIYGARASNGVVIITTKNGKYNQSKATITADISTGFSVASRLPDVLNAQQLGEVFFQSLRNDNIRGGIPNEPVEHAQFFPNGITNINDVIVPSTLLGASLGGQPVTANVNPGGTNFLDEIFELAPTQNFSLGLSNGSESSKYSLSLNYLNRQGVQLTTQFKRGQARLNSEFKVAKWLTVGQHTNIAFTQQGFGNSVQIAQRINPLIPVRDSEGRFAGSYSNSTGLSNATNPVADLLRADDDFFKQTRILGDVYAVANIIEGLSFKTIFGGDISIFNQRAFTALNPEHSEARGTNTLRERNQQTYNWTWTNSLNYSKTFGKHNINALIAIEAVENTGKSLEVSATGFLLETPDFYLLSNASGDPVVDPENTFDFENTLSSIFGSVNYSYGGKYLFTGTLRRDRSSRFIGDNQTDIFPAFSAGWIVSNEDFFPDEAIVNRLKFKGSWGELGNQDTGTGNPGSNVFNVNSQLSDFVFDGASGVQAGALLNQLGNPDITWETSESLNVGAELGLFNNALSLGIEYFQITTNDLIAPNLSVNGPTGIDGSAPLFNLGSIKNTGFDFNLSFAHKTKGDFSYGIDINVSTFENEVEELASDFFTGSGGFRGGEINRTQVGQPLSSFFGRVNTGIYRTEAEVIAGPDQGFATPADGVGRLRYEDLNGDGVINDDDRTFIGNPHPDFTFGVNLTAGYKNWDISAFFSGTVGNDIYNFDRIFTDFPTFFNGNRSTRVLDSFDPVTNPNGSAPALSATILNNETSPNSFFVEDGSFVRLKNLSIGYNFPAIYTDSWGVDGVRVYFTAANLFTITDYSGIDPEIQPTNGTNTALTLGVDENTFPISQIFTIGANLKL